MRREISELQSLQAEREARQRALYADERAELERLRYQNQRLQRRSEELESELEDSKRENRRALRPGYQQNNSSFSKGKDTTFRTPYDTNIYDDSNVNPLRPETTALDDSIANNQTMTLLQGQLNLMKQQLHISLDNTKFRETLNQKLYNTAPLPYNDNGIRNRNDKDINSSRASYREELDIDNDLDDRKEDGDDKINNKKMNKKSDKRYSPESLMETPYPRNSDRYAFNSLITNVISNIYLELALRRRV
jgi:hypothetical protein